jgi:hypothetical protein
VKRNFGLKEEEKNKKNRGITNREVYLSGKKATQRSVPPGIGWVSSTCRGPACMDPVSLNRRRKN